MNRAESRETLSTSTVKQAQKNAEAFTKAKIAEFTEQILKESGLLDDIYQNYVNNRETNVVQISKEDYLPLAVDDYREFFGKMIAISYALGYVDGWQKLTVKQIITGFKKSVLTP